jgi:arsenate reductase (thioredoxin)
MEVKMMEKKKVLFVCVHNSARSQMAEAFLNKLGGDKFVAESAGLEPGHLNPIVVEVMREIGIDISAHKTKSVFDMIKASCVFDIVFTVCDESQAGRCPVFPGNGKRIHMGFSDPAAFVGSYEEKLKNTRRVRDEIKVKIEEFIKDN